MIGATLGRYKIVGELGEGGMGVVYLAEHPLIGSKAVVKKLRPELCTNREVIDRFFNEARAATRIKHPGIVAIFDFGYAEDGTAYLVMEALEGESLGRRLVRLGGLREDVTLRLGRQIASALAAAHDVGIVHRDLKPDNVFVVADGEVEGGERVKILDFGIAKLASNEAEGITKTRTGAMMGSPLYMAPEQCRGAGEVDARADIYALGCVAYHAACGRPPFVAEGVGEIVAMHIYERPVPPSARNPEISQAFERFILRCLEKDPARRFARMQDVATELEAIRGLPAASGPRAPIAPTRVVDGASGGTPLGTDATTPATPAPAVPAPTVAAGSSAGALANRPERVSLPEPPARARARSRWWIGGAVVAIGGGAAVALGLLAGDPPRSSAPPEVAVARPAASTDASTPSTAAVETPPSVPAAPVDEPTSPRAPRQPATTAPAPVPVPAKPEPEPTPTPATPTPTKPRPTPTPAADAAVVTIRLRSVPPGALVTRKLDGRRLGRTPYTASGPPGEGEEIVVLSARGHVAREVAVPRSRDFADVIVLERRRPPGDPTTTRPNERKRKRWGETINPLDE